MSRWFFLENLGRHVEGGTTPFSYVEIYRHEIHMSIAIGRISTHEVMSLCARATSACELVERLK